MSLTMPTPTGYSGFWGGVDGYVPIPRSQHGMRSPLERRLARTFKRNQLRELVAVMTALNGAAAGGTASATYTRVAAPASTSGATPAPTELTALGGVRNVETVTVINRATTAADELYVDDLLNGDLLSMERLTQGQITPVGSSPFNGVNGQVALGTVWF